MAKKSDQNGMSGDAGVEGQIKIVEALIDGGRGDEADRAADMLVRMLDSKKYVVSALGDVERRRLASLEARAANSLRKVNRINEALIMARRAYAIQSDDIWIVRSYGWAVRDAIKDAKDRKDDRSALDLVLEYDRIQIPESETLLLEQRAHYHVGLVGTEQHLADAFRIAKEKYRDNPADAKTVVQYFWVLSDCVEQAMWLKKPELAKQFYDEIRKLPGRDARQENKMRLLEAKLDPAYALSRDAAAMSKLGDYVMAAEQYREALRQGPQSKAAQEGLGWALARLLDAEVGKKSPDGKKIIGILREYLSLRLLAKPSRLHSWILALASRAATVLGQNYFIFVKHWDLHNLRDEDYKCYKPNKRDGTAEDVLVAGGGGEQQVKELPSLAEKVGMALGKVAKTFKRNELLPDVDLRWAATSLGSLVARFPGHPLLPYYYAVLQIRIGELAEARRHLIPLLLAKFDEFWLWGALAETYPPASGEQVACLSKAYLSRPKDLRMLSGVKRRLGAALQQAGDSDAAEVVLNTVVFIGFEDCIEGLSNNVPTGGGTAVKSAVKSMIVSKTQNPSSTREAALNRLRGYAREAEALVMANEPWVPAVVSGIVAPKGPIKGGILLLVNGDGDRLVELRVKRQQFTSLQGASLGMAVSIQLAKSDGRQIVVRVMRRDGTPWDLLPKQRGVVISNNPDKGVTAIAVGMDQTALSYHDRCPLSKELAAGDLVEFRCQGGLNNRCGRLVWLERSTEAALVESVRPYQGKLRRNESGYGFVDDIYLPGLLLGEYGDGSLVKGLAVIETNRRSGVKGWRAITVQCL